jgi:hypothetical protein
MLSEVPSETLAAFAGMIPRGSDASATAAVPAIESLMRLERGKTTSYQMVSSFHRARSAQRCLPGVTGVGRACFALVAV